GVVWVVWGVDVKEGARLGPGGGVSKAGAAGACCLDDANRGKAGPPPPQESPGPFTRRHAPASYRSLVIPSGEFPALCAAGRRGAGAPPGRGAATQCALQAVAGLGPRRPRRSYE